MPCRLTPPPAADASVHIGEKVGLDANLPIHSDGTLSEQVANPQIIAGSNVGWVRLNFVLGPWNAVTDETVYSGFTWQQAYTRIIAGFRGQGLRIYGLIGNEIVNPSDFKDIFRQPPPAQITTHTWIEEYVATYVTVLNMFCADLQVVESINEPDDYHGAADNWIHPGWFAIILHRLHEAVQSDRRIAHVRLVSGPVQGFDANNNDGARYLAATYQVGIRRFGWGKNKRPFPFDAVGYHLYIAEDLKGWTVQKTAIRRTYSRYLNELKKVIQQAEWSSKSICVSEAGWHSNGGKEELQKQSLPYAISLLHNDPWVELAIAFCTQDFGPEAGNKFYGLYRPDGVTLWHRKPVYYPFQRLCARTATSTDQPKQNLATDATHRDIVNAFHIVSNTLGLGDWGLMLKAELDVAEFARSRSATYSGPAIEDFSTLSEEEQRLLMEELPAVVELSRLSQEKPGFLLAAPVMATAASSPPPSLIVRPGQPLSPTGKRVARVWNRYGHLLLQIADELTLPLATAVAVLAQWGDSRGYGAGDRLAIRFDPYRFFREWGRTNRSLFDQHFRLDESRPWLRHWVRSDVNDDWADVHISQQTEWLAFELAQSLDGASSFSALRMGIPRIMGCNASLVGYPAAETMYYAFASSERAQILAIFDLVSGPDRGSPELRALQEGRFSAFATLFFGSRETAFRQYALEMAVETFQGWKPLGSE